MATDPEDLPDAPTQQSPKTKIKKRKNPSAPQSKQETTTQFSLRKPQWAYIRLRHLSSSSSAAKNSDDHHPLLDLMTARMHLTAALTAFLGVHGAAIAFDIMKLESQDVWIRVQSDDRAAVIAATGGWVSSNRESWAVKSWSHWNAMATGRQGGDDLFQV